VHRRRPPWTVGTWSRSSRGRTLGAGACFIRRGRSVSCRGCDLEKQGDIHVHPDCPILVFGAMLDATLESIFGLDLISEGVAR
jgi:hypothetical protein